MVLCMYEKIIAALAGGFVPSTVCSGEGDPPPDGGGAPPAPEKSFSQADVDRIVKSRLADVEKRFEPLKAQAQKTTELETQLEALRSELEMKGKSADEKARIEAERERKAYAKKIEELDAQHKQASERATKFESAWKKDRIEAVLQRALVSKGAVKDARALAQATSLFAADGAAELSEDGSAVKLVLDDMNLNPEAAAEAWLRLNPHFAGHPGGGSGTRASNGAKLPPNLTDMSAEELAQIGWANPPTK